MSAPVLRVARACGRACAASRGRGGRVRERASDALGKALSAFLQQSQPDGLSYDNSDSEAKAYGFQSGGVVDMLEKLKERRPRTH